MTEPDSVRLSCHAVEHVIREIWSGYFGREVSPYDDFFDLGGDSLAMIDVVVAARGCGLPLRSSVALRNPSPARLAESLTVGAPSVVELPALLADSPMVTQDSRVEPVADGVGDALYVVHSDSHVQAERSAIAAWGGERPVRAFRLLAGNLGEIAGRFVTAVRREQPAGPYRLAGFGHGAVVAYEMACQLSDVALLALVTPPVVGPAVDPEQLLRARLTAIAARFGLGGGECVEQIHAEMRAGGWYDDTVEPAELPALQRVWLDLAAAARDYRFAELDVPTVLFHDVMDADGATERALRVAIKDLEIHRLDYGLESPHAVIGDSMVAQAMRKALAA
jgi:thioesterase domain-containing protein